MSFRDAFTKSKESLVDYDDTASLYFFGTVVLVVLLPLVYSFSRQIIGAVTGSTILPRFSSTAGARLKYCECSLCRANNDRLKEECRKKYFRSARFKLVLLAIIFLSVLAGYLIYNLAGSKGIQTFDPFETLEVRRGASDKEIRRAYRTSSLKYHPDKNPNDPTAQAKFIMISKAYQALTDETAKKNYELYGNPDGPSALRVGIGLPSFVVDEENHQLVLVLFMVLFIFLMPLSFIAYYRKTALYYPSGTLVETVHLFGCLMTEGTVGFRALELIALSAESAQQPCSKNELQEVRRLVLPKLKNYAKLTVGAKLAEKCPAVERNYILLLAHLNNVPLSAELQKPLKKLLVLVPAMTQSMIEVAALNNWSATVKYLIDLRRCLVQGCGFGTSPLTQIPHMTPTLIERLHRSDVQHLLDFLRKKDAREKVLSANLSPGQKADVDAFLAHVSDIGVSVKTEVLGESQIAAGDLITVTITLQRRVLKEKEALGAIHAPRFPDVKQEEWWAFLGGRRTQTLVGYCALKGQGKFLEEQIQFFAPPHPGNYLFEVVLMCDSHAGLDLVLALPITSKGYLERHPALKLFPVARAVISQDAAKREVFVHPQDEELDQQPSLFTSMFGPSNEDEEEEEKPSENDPPPAKTFEKENNQQQSAEVAAA